MEFTQSNCRICLKSDAPLYVSVEDQLLEENIVDLIQEISRKRILITDGLSKLICMACCKNLAVAIRTKRLFLRNDEALMHCFQYCQTKIQINDDDPFLAEFDLEFESPDDDESCDAPLFELEPEKQDEDSDSKMEVEALDEELAKVSSEDEIEYEKSPQSQISLHISKLEDNSCAETEVSAVEDEKVTPVTVDEEEQVIEPPPRQKRPVKQNKLPKADPQLCEKVRKGTVDKISVLEIRSDELKLTCCMCKFTAATEVELVAHLHSHPERRRRSAFQKKIKEAAPDQKKSNAGKLCIKCLRRVPDLQYHIKYFYVTQKFQCSQCGTCFGFYQQMKQHEQKCIRKAKVKAGLMPQEKFECHICAKLLKTKAILESHTRLHLMTDADRTKFKCQICNRGYPSMRSLRCHVLLHTDVAIFQCPMCEKAFKKRNNLQAHIRVHNNSRIFKCTYCEKSYIHSIDRKRHEMAVHTGERPFKCQLCNDGFVKRYSLKLHMKKVHLIDINTVDLFIIEEDSAVKVD